MCCVCILKRKENLVTARPKEYNVKVEFIVDANCDCRQAIEKLIFRDVAQLSREFRQILRLSAIKRNETGREVF